MFTLAALSKRPPLRSRSHSAMDASFAAWVELRGRAANPWPQSDFALRRAVQLPFELGACGLVFDQQLGLHDGSLRSWV